MPGFGSGAFGEGGSGKYDWSRHVLWRDLPGIDRRMDASTGGGRLEQWADALGEVFDDIARFAEGMESLRDPDSVRTQFDDNLAITITATEASTDGRTVRVTVSDADPSDPFTPLAGTAPGWILRDADDTEFTVNEVHKLSDAFVITGNTEPALGAAVLRPPAMISLLGQDFGVEIDQHDPAPFQRSAVRNVWQWLAVKGAQKSYWIIGKIAGYDVVAYRMWAVSNPAPENIPPSNVYEIPEGSGNLYTDYEPRRALFDQVACDVIPMDYYCWETPDWTSDSIEPPSPPLADDTSVTDAIASYTQSVPIISTTDLGDGSWRIRVGPTDLWPIVEFHNWSAEFTGSPVIDTPLETTPAEDSGSPGEWEFDVVAGTAPSFGTTVNLNYTCPLTNDCTFCASSNIRVVMIPNEIAADPEALLNDSLERMVRKIRNVIPVHVRDVSYVHRVEVQANVFEEGVHLIANASSSRQGFAYAFVGYYFDLLPADEVTVDPAHLVADSSSTTIP